MFKLQESKRFKIKNRNIESWTEILNYKEIKVKVLKFKERYKKGKEIKEDTIYVVSTDLTMKEETMNKIIHERWDIENIVEEINKAKYREIEFSSA